MDGKFAIKLRHICTKQEGRRESLHNVSITIQQGEAVAFLQKDRTQELYSCLKNLLSRSEEPTFGTLRINGRIKALENGPGFFHVNTSGRKNIYRKGAEQGLEKIEIEEMEEEILTFAELGDLIDEPVKSYSEEMKMRLAFAITYCMRDGILLMDPNFALKETVFLQKCQKKLEAWIQTGGTLLLVTNSADAADFFCKRGIVLKNGRLVEDSEINEALESFQQL
ncbi:hypothetical protein [Anaerovorax odorimutans]|nr:hypothetical protein [Anaerovorax odorimutans]